MYTVEMRVGGLWVPYADYQTEYLARRAATVITLAGHDARIHAGDQIILIATGRAA